MGNQKSIGKIYTAFNNINEISTPSIPSIANQIIEHLTKEQIDEVYVSFDIDAIDEKYASATGTPEPNGLSPEMPMMLLAPILEKFKCTGADMVEVAPWVSRSMGETALQK